MDFILNDVEARVLGALLEKELTTPEYYPLSLAGLTTACNQKSNREPIVAYDEATVTRAVDTLREKRLVVRSDAGRVFKFAETLVKRFNLLGREAAILTVLLLRGPQTVGELRGRTERAHAFDSIAEVEATLTEMAEAGYVMKLPRQPGRKESRYAHLLCGEPDLEALSSLETVTGHASSPGDEERFSRLEGEVEELRQELARLQAEFARFQAQFE